MKKDDSPAFRGFYRDQLYDVHQQPIWDGGWRPNLVVSSCNALLAALMKGEPGFSGILFWAVGEGMATWDHLIPSPTLDDWRLANEIARKALTANEIAYLDEDRLVTEGPTVRLQISATFAREELGGQGPRSLREFGLFGGDATAAANSGWMINYVIHPPIQFFAGMTLTRNLHLTFGIGGTGIGDAVGGFGGELPVMRMDGVGEQFSADLGAAGVTTLNDLIAIDPLEPIAGIPAVRLREFRAKARMVLQLRADLAPFASLSERSISNLLQADPEALAGEIGVPAVTAAAVMQMQEKLAVLQVALDETALQEIPLGTLISS